MRVRTGPGFVPDGAGYRVSPGRREDWQALVGALGATDRLPDQVVHAWGLGDEFEPGLDHAFFAPLYLFQAMETEAPARSLTFVAAVSGIFPGSADGVRAERAALLGPVRVAPREIPTLKARLISVDGIPSEASRRGHFWERLVDEIGSRASETVVAYRGAERWVEDFTKVEVDRGASAVVPAGPCLVTGGLGGLGPVVARTLVRRGVRRIALVGRTALPPRSAWDTWRSENPGEVKILRAIAEVEGLEAMGAEVMVVRADVTDVAAIRNVIESVEEAFGPLVGVVHAAGVLDDGPLLDRTRERAESVLGAKVAGVRALDAALGDRTLDLFWLFSSVSAVIGAPGQVDYAAANAVLDAYAHERGERTGEPVLSLAWGAWQDVGMAAELAGQARYDELAEKTHGARELDHPLFDRVRTTSDGATAYAVDLSVDRHWMLAEHELRGGGWVLPGSGYVEIIRGAAALEAPERPFALRDLVFLKPFRVRTGEAPELEVRLTPREDGGFDASVQGRRARGAWVEHAVAWVADGPDAPASRNGGLSSLRDRLGTPSIERRPPHPVMEFGPRWANISAVATGDGEALLQQRLPGRFESDLAATALHPALLDMATAGATHLVEGVDPARDFLIPAGYGRLDLYRALDARPSSHVRLQSVDPDAGLVSFDVTVYDGDGAVAVEIEDFSMIRVQGNDLSEETTDGPAWLRDALAPSEGEAVMELLLGAAVPPHLLVSRRALSALLREADRAPAQRSNRTRIAAPPTRVPLPEVSDALEGHPAVREAAALGSRDESEPARVVAFVQYEAGEQATVSELRRFLKSRLKRRWVPQNFVEVVSLPRGGDGAIQVADLRDPFAATDDYVAPRTPTEEAIAGIWAELLGLERVGIHDNFLDVGGHSLVGIRVLLRIQQSTGVRIEANALTMQTLEQVAADVDRQS